MRALLFLLVAIALPLTLGACGQRVVPSAPADKIVPSGAH